MFRISKNKRGISDVITNVLIILLVLGAVVILWGFLRPAIQRGGEQLGQADCLTLVVEPTNCAVGTNSNVTVRWVSGDVNVTKVRAVITSSDGQSTAGDDDAPASVGSTTRITFGSLAGTQPFMASAQGIITVGGKEFTCAESVKISCS